MRRSPLVFGLLLTLAHLALLAFRIPLLANTPGWFWPFYDKPFASPVLLVVGLVVVFASLLWAVKSAAPAAPRLLAVFFTGVFIQHGLALQEGRGLEGMRDRIVFTGHAELARVAVEHDDAYALFTNYESLVASKSLGVFAPSKPPGTLLFYSLTDHLAQAIEPSTDLEARIVHLQTVATVWWPFVSMLSLLPLFALARLLGFDARGAMSACVLFAVVPSVQLATLHTDQVIYPFVTLLSAAAVAWAMRRRSVPLALLAGATVSFAMFFSFPLGAGGAMAAVAGLAWLEPTTRLREISKMALGLIAGAALITALMKLAFDYDAIVRFKNAVAYHAAWRTWRGRPIDYVHFFFLGLTEFALWLGLPLATLGSLEIGRALSDVRKRIVSTEPVTLLAVALFGVLLFLALFGRTKGEVARLWLFLMPFACVIAARANERMGLPQLLPLTIALQMAVLLATKRFEDFR